MEQSSNYQEDNFQQSLKIQITPEEINYRRKKFPGLFWFDNFVFQFFF